MMLSEVQVSAVMDAKQPEEVRAQFIEFLETNFSGQLNSDDSFSLSSSEFQNCQKTLNSIREISQNMPSNLEEYRKEDEELQEELVRYL